MQLNTTLGTPFTSLLSNMVLLTVMVVMVEVVVMVMFVNSPSIIWFSCRGLQSHLVTAKLSKVVASGLPSVSNSFTFSQVLLLPSSFTINPLILVLWMSNFTLNLDLFHPGYTITDSEMKHFVLSTVSHGLSPLHCVSLLANHGRSLVKRQAR